MSTGSEFAIRTVDEILNPSDSSSQLFVENIDPVYQQVEAIQRSKNSSETINRFKPIMGVAGFGIGFYLALGLMRW